MTLLDDRAGCPRRFPADRPTAIGRARPRCSTTATSYRYLPSDDAGVLSAIAACVDGMPVVAFCERPDVQGGAMGTRGLRRPRRRTTRAVAAGCPIVGLWHSGGARLREGVQSLDAVGHVFAAMTHASDECRRSPSCSARRRAARRTARRSPTSSSSARKAAIFVTGPDVVRSVTGEDVDMLRLGGPEPHGRRSGVVHIIADTEARGTRRRRAGCRRCSASQGDGIVDGGGRRPGRGCCRSRRSVRTTSTRSSSGLLDEDSSLELHATWAPNIVTTLGRFGGRTVGVIANNPLRLGGCLDSASAEKAARFVRMCDAFGVPLVVLVDVPGYLPGVGQEWDGVVRRGAKLLHAFAEAVVPRVTLVTRKAYGGAYIAMNSRSLGATRVFAWPRAEVAVMGSTAAVRILHRRKLAEVDRRIRPRSRPSSPSTRAASPAVSTGRCEIGVVDAVVDPRAPGQRWPPRSPHAESPADPRPTATSRSRAAAGYLLTRGAPPARSELPGEFGWPTAWSHGGAAFAGFAVGSSSSSQSVPRSRSSPWARAAASGCTAEEGAQPVLAARECRRSRSSGARNRPRRGRRGVPLAVGPGTRLLGDLEPEPRPPADRRGEPPRRAGRPAPGRLGPQRAGAPPAARSTSSFTGMPRTPDTAHSMCGHRRRRARVDVEHAHVR